MVKMQDGFYPSDLKKKKKEEEEIVITSRSMNVIIQKDIVCF